MNIEEKEQKKYKGDKLSETIIVSLEPFWNKLKENGIKESIKNFIPNMDINNFVLNKIRNQLSKRRGIEFNNKYLGRVDIQYRGDGIQIEPTAFPRLFIKKITITDSQIIASLDSILKQIEEKYIANNEYIIGKIDEIVASLSSTGIYKPKNSEEKTLYDLAMLILLNYYEVNKEIPKWIEQALKNISKGKFLKSWISLLIDHISEVITQVSENIFINFKVTFDSLVVRTILNKATNKGQISHLLNMLNIDVRKIIFNFAKNYVSPSFIRGIADILVNLVNDFLSGIDNKFDTDSSTKFNYDSLEPFNVTISPGKNFRIDRAFMWYTGESYSDCFLEYSYNENFENSFKVKSICEEVSKTVPTINLGLVSGYKVVKLNKHKVCIEGLEAGTVYYKIHSGDTFESDIYKFKVENPKDNFEFNIFADSQGMVKADYDLFLEVLERAIKNNNPDFLVHLGDFVDDGNNEEYWKWVLDSKVWKENICVPLSGNHEARINGVAMRAGVENSIVGHFNVQNVPFQNLSKGLYYSFDYNNTTFVVLNTNSDNNEFAIDDIQYNWALNVLKKSKSKWKIIFAHKTPYSNGPHSKDSDVKKIGYQISELAYQGKADIVLGGHDHVYVRTSIMSYGKNVGCEKIISKILDSKPQDTFINPFGTIFVVPGTSGVKNYKQDTSVILPAQKLLDLNKPVYSKICISDSELIFKAYTYDDKCKSFSMIDTFSIKKESKKINEIDNRYMSKLIDSIPGVPWIDKTEKLAEIKKLYDSLVYAEKIKVNNSKKLFNAVRLNRNYLDIINSEICRVNTKNEFFSAICNPNIGTIIVDCDELKFGDKFSKNSKVFINRPICIRGSAKLSYIKFILKDKSMLILSDNICIDNTRKITSVYISEDIFDLNNDSTLIINDNVSINSSFCLGSNGKGINVIGENCNIYMNSSSANFVDKGFLQSLNNNSNIVVNSGKYISNNSNPTFIINSHMTVKGGFIKNIKGLAFSNLEINGGIIGENNNLSSSVPIESSGSIKITSGKIRDKNGVSILMNNSKEILVDKDNSYNSVDIAGKIIYN